MYIHFYHPMIIFWTAGNWRSRKFLMKWTWRAFQWRLMPYTTMRPRLISRPQAMLFSLVRENKTRFWWNCLFDGYRWVVRDIDRVSTEIEMGIEMDIFHSFRFGCGFSSINELVKLDPIISWNRLSGSPSLTFQKISLSTPCRKGIAILETHFYLGVALE